MHLLQTSIALQRSRDGVCLRHVDAREQPPLAPRSHHVITAIAGRWWRAWHGGRLRRSIARPLRLHAPERLHGRQRLYLRDDRNVMVPIFRHRSCVRDG